jgi:hypothetical protein
VATALYTWRGQYPIQRIPAIFAPPRTAASHVSTPLCPNWGTSRRCLAGGDRVRLGAGHCDVDNQSGSLQADDEQGDITRTVSKFEKDMMEPLSNDDTSTASSRYIFAIDPDMNGALVLLHCRMRHNPGNLKGQGPTSKDAYDVVRSSHKSNLLKPPRCAACTLMQGAQGKCTRNCTYTRNCKASGSGNSPSYLHEP